MKKITRICIVGCVAAAVFFGFAGGSAAATYPNGTLLRAAGEDRVYVLEKGQKRWIASAAAFRAHGFLWEDVREVTSAELSAYVEGEALSATSTFIMPGEEASLPDLVPFPPTDFRFAKRAGRTILKFSSMFFNRGRGPLELVGDTATRGVAGDVERDVLQRITRPDGSERNKVVGTFLWHELHKHYHFSDFAEYRFGKEGDDKIPTVREKSTRCLWDTKAVALDLDGAPREKSFATCKNKERQGVSVGWGDVYDYTLADQYLDVHDLPAGVYRLVVEVDPRGRFAELRKDNNTSIALLNIDVQKGAIKVIAAAAPFSHPASSSYPDGMLVRADGDEKVYRMHHNKKRWLKSEEVLRSYGQALSDISVFPRSIVDAIASTTLVRPDGRNVYALNDRGYRRHIKDPAVFDSYGYDWQDIADSTPEEFAGYGASRLVRVLGVEETYYYADGDALRPMRLEPSSAKTFSVEEVHVITKEDFASYALGLETSGILQ